jgi:hypothetical protein
MLAISRNLSSNGAAPQQQKENSRLPEFGGLVSDLSDYVGVQLTASRRDMGQAETLLADAVARLLACLPNLEKARSPSGEVHTGTDLARLTQAVVNMQFQDLVSQLLRRADERLAGLDKLLQELARILSDKDPSALHAAVQCLGSQTLAPERRTNSSIQQLSMAPGDVELF